ncbi:LysR family transcriptional regulator [Pseudomonas serbica]
MSQMTLKQLEAFYWAATCGSFAIASEKLHISQSSLSKRLVELEMALKRPLFNRDGRRAILTADGRAFLPRAKSLLNHVDEVVASVSAAEAIQGRCRFGVGEIAASSWMPRLVSSLRILHPQLKLELYVDLGVELETNLLSGKLDGAIIAKSSSHPALESIPLAQAEYIWVAGKNLLKPGSLVEDAIADFPIVTMAQHAGSTSLLDNWRLRSKAVPCEVIESNSMATIAGLVAAGVAIGYLPKGWLRPMLRNNAIVPVLTNTPLDKLNYRFYWRRDDYRPVISALREMALKVADYDAPFLML